MPEPVGSELLPLSSHPVMRPNKSAKHAEITELVNLFIMAPFFYVAFVCERTVSVLRTAHFVRRTEQRLVGRLFG